MGKKHRKQSPADEVICIGEVGFIFEAEVRGCRCTHLLYRSVKGGYLVSFTNIDAELGEIGNRGKRGYKSWVR